MESDPVLGSEVAVYYQSFCQERLGASQGVYFAAVEKDQIGEEYEARRK